MKAAARRPAPLAVLAMLATAVLSGTLLFAAPAPAAAATPLPGDSVYQLDVPLTGQDGTTRDWEVLRGRPRLVAMFYTSCQYICPLIVDSGKAVERALTPAQRDRLGIVLVSMDAARDDPAALRTVAAQRKLDPARWWLASPREGDVRSVAGVLGIRYRALADGEFNHTSALVLLDAEGRIVARTGQVGSRPDPEFLARVRALLDG